MRMLQLRQRRRVGDRAVKQLQILELKTKSWTKT